MREHNIHIPSAKIKQIYLMHYIGFELKTFYETPCNKGLMCTVRECVRNLDLRVQVHPRELWVSKQRVHIVLEASKSAGAKGDVPKICKFLHQLHLC